MKRKIKVSGTGCCLVDRVYNNISFAADDFTKYLSRERGDGGLTPGQLVFREEFETYANKNYTDVLSEITCGKSPDKVNIGGPCIVALIHAAQISGKDIASYYFYGSRGNDETGEYLKNSLKKTPVDISKYKTIGEFTPSTDVLSDPEFDNGHGERIFINSISSAWDYFPQELDDDFFSSDIVVFGGTAIVPRIHDDLTELLKKAKSKKCVTVVNTVFDFRSEKQNPSQKWSLGSKDDSYEYIDLLVSDKEEALRISGCKTTGEAVRFFAGKGVGAVVITNGAGEINLFSAGKLFEPLENTQLPVSQKVSEELILGKHTGDTTGCGDNFVGGMIASIAEQLYENAEKADLIEAVSLGVVSGGYACFYVGGTYIEKKSGEKHALIQPYLNEYKKQIKHLK